MSDRELIAQAAEQPAEPVDDERIITNAMLRAQDQERMAALEGLLREALAVYPSLYDDEVALRDRIEAALRKEG